MADISKVKVTQNGSSAEYIVKDATARAAIANITSDLANYYLKTETYNKSEVDNLIAGIKQFTYVVAESLPTASASTMYKIYLIPSAHSVTSNVRDEYITIQDGSTYKFEQIGSTAADFSAYSTTEEMNTAIATALEDYYSKDEVDSLIVGLAADVRDDIQTLKEEVNDTYAKKDGDYETLGAGSATNLKGNTVSNAKFAFRTAGGSADIATGQAQLNVVRGNTVVWNQLLNSNFTYSESGITFNVVNGLVTFSGTPSSSYVRLVYTRHNTLTAGHKFAYVTSLKTEGLYFRMYSFNVGTVASTAFGENSIATIDNVGGDLQLRMTTNVGQYYSGSFYPLLFDLTLMFGAGNEPSSIEEFKAMFPEAYYPYSAPTLLSFRADGIKTVGFNQFNYATGKAKVIPNMEYQITGAYTSLSMNGETITPDSDGIFTPTQYGEVAVTGGGTNTCIHLVWSGKRNGEFEEYWESRLAHPLTQLTGKLNGEGESVVVFPDGLRSAGTVHDEIVGNKAIKRVGSVDLGTLTWDNLGDGYLVLSGSLNGLFVSGSGVSSKYTIVSYGTLYNSHPNNAMSIHTNGYIYICDNSLSGKTSSQIKAALSGVIIYYELATPEEYILYDFRLPAGYRVDDFGTEEIYVNEGLTTPCDLDVIYGINAADTIRRLPDNYVSATKAQEFTELEKAQARRNIGVLSEDDAARKDGVYKEMVVGGSLNLVDSSDDTVPREFTFDTAGGTSDIGTGLAVLKRLNGNTIVWNQEVLAAYKSGSVTFTEAGTYYRTLYDCNLPVVSQHKYYISCNIERSISGNDYIGIQLVIGSREATISLALQNGEPNGRVSGIQSLGNVTATSVSSIRVNNYIGKQGFDAGDSVSYDNLMLIDLTQMFGAGNEPSTVEEFEKLFPLNYYDYNAGSLISFNGTGLKTTGLNQFNNETATIGQFVRTDGTLIDNSSYFCSDYIRVLPSTNYYLKDVVAIGFQYSAICFNSNKEAIGSLYISGQTNKASGVVTTPTDCAYIRINAFNVNIDTVCVNLSWSGTKNGTYEPYEEHTLNYDISAIQDGEGNQLFPLGLLSAGDVHDELTAHKAIKRVGVVDMGTLTWDSLTQSSLNCFRSELTDKKHGGGNMVCVPYAVDTIFGTTTQNVIDDNEQNINIYVRDSSYSTAADFKAAMSGVMLYYELATPIEVDFDEQLNLSYNVNDWGTEQLLPENGTTPTTSPAKFDIVYNVNAVDTLKNLSRNYLAQGDLDTLLTALGTALGFTYTKTWNQETKEWAFTVTPTTQGE